MAALRYLAPKFLEEGRLCWLRSPLYIVKNGKNESYYFTDEEFNKVRGKIKGEVSRAKGLGALSQKQAEESMFGEFQRMDRLDVDDDAIYDIKNVCRAISYAVDNHCIVNLADLFYSNVFNHSIHKEVIHWYDNEPNYFTTFCAQCVIPPFTFPCECMTEEVLDIRRRICQRCDESWINPWLIAHRVKVYTPDCVISRPASYEKENTTWEIMNKCEGKFAFRDVQLFAVLNKFPYLFEQWTSLFRGYMKVKEDIPQILSLSEGLEIKEDDLNKIPDYIRNH